MSGLQDEIIAIECLREGAQDYLVKSRLSTESIVRSVKYAIQRHRIQSELRKGKQEFDSGEYRVHPPAYAQAAGTDHDLFGASTAEMTIDETSLLSFANRLALIIRTCGKGNTVSADVVSL
jgi:DNA-binding response OmpR family regulator